MHLKKWALGIIITLFVALTLTFLFFRWHIDHVLGGNTQVVDATQFKSISGALAITNVSVLSGDSQSMLDSQTVLVKGQIIESIGANIAVPDGYHVIDGTGQFLIPGLIDAHVHIKKSPNDLLLYIANGVTQIGEMTGMEEHFDYLEQINNGAVGPDIYIASPKLSSQQGLHPTLRSWFEKRHKNYSTTEEAREAVRYYHASGYKAIKLSSDLNETLYRAIIDEAKKLNIPVIGHLPVGLGMNDLYGSGQSQLAHIESITQSERNQFGWFDAAGADAYLIRTSDKADRIAARLKEDNIVIASTLWLHAVLPDQDFDLTEFLKSIELEYQNPGWIEGSIVSRGWLPGNNSNEKTDKNDPENVRESEVYWQTHNQSLAIITQALVRNGVTIVAGTDSHGAIGMIAGFALHKELQTLKKAGLTNAQVLHSATVAPAQWMNINTGIIEPGFRADLVLLKQNPLVDISNTKKINSVIANGRYFDRSQLDSILAAVKDANANSASVSIDAFIK